MATAGANAADKLQERREDLVVFPLLADKSYDPSTFDYVSNAPGQPSYKEWIECGRRTAAGFKKTASQDKSVEDAEKKAAQFEERFLHILDTLDKNPDAETAPYGSGRVDCLRLVRLRDWCLRDAGFTDPWADIKKDETAKALELLPEVLKEVDAHEDAGERLRFVVTGVFAGNMFDLGTSELAERFEQGESAGKMFRESRESLLPQPWAVDELDALLERFADKAAGSHKKALLLVDNAGSDVVLGMLPFARELLQRGTEVVFAANESPSINDVTALEMTDILSRAGDCDGVLKRGVAEGALRAVSSGNDTAAIDLKTVSAELAAEAKDADLVVLEGMGRGIETNLWAALTVEKLNMAMVKHPEVAHALGCRVYDCVVNWQPAGKGGELPKERQERGKQAS